MEQKSCKRSEIHSFFAFNDVYLKPLLSLTSLNLTLFPGKIYVQNFLFTTKEEHAQLKAIDFGLSDFIKPGELFHLLSYFWSPSYILGLHCIYCGVSILLPRVNYYPGYMGTVV